MGTEILDETRKFKFVKGPIYANIVLADEINRTPPNAVGTVGGDAGVFGKYANAITYTCPTHFCLSNTKPIEQERNLPTPRGATGPLYV